MGDAVGFSAVGATNTVFDLRNSVSAGTTAAAEPVSTPAAPQVKAATYYSPNLHFDQSVDQLVIQYRNPDNGDVERQYPSRQAIQQYQQAQQQKQAGEAAARLTAVTTGHAPTPQIATSSSGKSASVPTVKTPPVVSTVKAPVSTPDTTAATTQASSSDSHPATGTARGITA